MVEVLSDSTMETDRREKLAAYRKLPGLRAYWIVSQSEQRVEMHARDAAGQWRADDHGRGAVIPAAWLGGDAFAVAGFYGGTDVA